MKHKFKIAILLILCCLTAAAEGTLRVGTFTFIAPGYVLDDPLTYDVGPTIQFSAYPEGTMYANPGLWEGNPYFRYQWTSNGVDIPDATGSSFIRGVSSADTWTYTLLASNALGSLSVTSGLSPQMIYSGRYLMNSAADANGGPSFTNFAGTFSGGKWISTIGTNYFTLPKSTATAYTDIDNWNGNSYVFSELYVTNRGSTGVRDATTDATIQFSWNRQITVVDTNMGMFSIGLRENLNEPIIQWRTDPGAFDPFATNHFEVFFQLAVTNEPVKLFINSNQVSLVASNRQYLTETNKFANPTTAFMVGSFNSAGTPAQPWHTNASIGAFEIRRQPAMFSVGSSIPVFTAGIANINTYRIQALVRNPWTGVIHAFSEARTNTFTDDGDIGIAYSRSTDNGATWSYPRVIYYDGRRNYDPNPFIGPDQKLKILWLNNSANDTPTELINATGSGEPLAAYLMSSPDDGITWQTPSNITSQLGVGSIRYALIGPDGITVFTNGPNAGRILGYGSYVTSNTAPGRVDQIIYSDNNGTNWSVIARDISTTNLNNGEMNVRTFMETNAIAIRRLTIARKGLTVSTNGGTVWSDPIVDQRMFGPPIQNGLLIDGTNIYVSTISNTGKTTADADRYNLVLYRGSINAVGEITWNGFQVIDRRPSGYSSMINLGEGKIGILYENGDFGGSYIDGIVYKTLIPYNDGKAPVLTGNPFPGELITSSSAGQFYVDGVATGSPSQGFYTVGNNDIGKTISIIASGRPGNNLKVWHPTNTPGTALAFVANLSVTNAAGTPVASIKNLADDTWITQSTSASQATNVANAYSGNSALRFGLGDNYPFDSTLLGALNDKSYVYVIAGVRDFDRTNGTQRGIVEWSSEASSNTTRFALRTRQSSSSYFFTGARAQTGDSFVSSVSASVSNVVVLTSKIELGKARQELRLFGSQAHSAFFQNSNAIGSSSALAGGIGGHVGAVGTFSGDISGVIVIARTNELSDSELRLHELYISKLVGRQLAPTNQWPNWGTNTYQLASVPKWPILATNIIAFPDGAEIDELVESTHRYRHVNTQIIDPRTGRRHLMFSSGGASEDSGGQTIGYSYTDNDGTNWSSQSTIFAGPDTMDTNLNAFQPVGSFASFAGIWHYDQPSSKLYAVSWVEELKGGYENSILGKAAFAREVLTNGTFGTVFRITTNAFTPKAGRLNPTFSSTLSALLLPKLKVYGTWGGTANHATNFSTNVNFGAFVTQDGLPGYELRTWSRDGSSTNLIQLVRYDFDQRQHARWTSDGGESWSPTFQTGLPSGSATDLSGISFMFGDRRWDGGHFAIGNHGVGRSNMWLALMDSQLRVTNVLNVQTNIPSGAPYPGGGKGGGVAYPSATLNSNNVLVITYSFQKSSIGSSTIKLP